MKTQQEKLDIVTLCGLWVKNSLVFQSCCWYYFYMVKTYGYMVKVMSQLLTFLRH